MIRFLVFMGIWMIGCAIVDFAFSDIANAWKMAIGAYTAFIGFTVSELIDFPNKG